jgi:hypothetical protein
MLPYVNGVLPPILKDVIYYSPLLINLAHHLQSFYLVYAEIVVKYAISSDYTVKILKVLIESEADGGHLFVICYFPQPKYPRYRYNSRSR